MIVAVGSINPTKTNPVKKIFSHHFKNVEVVGVSVSSGVKDQPTHIDEAYQGALNRAKAAMKEVKSADYGVGIEGGLHQHKYGWFESSMVVVIDRKGQIGVGSSGGLVLPPKIIKEIQKGKNLEEAVDTLFGTKNVGSGIGMFGLMTKEVVTRSTGVEHGVAFALARFLHPKLYQ